VTADDAVRGHLELTFRRRYAVVCAALLRQFGPRQLPLVEDVVQDAMCRAVHVWARRGIPDDSTAWLIRVAYRLAIDRVRRDQRGERLNAVMLESRHIESAEPDAALTHEIRDAELRLLFTCADPTIPLEGQVALALSVMCGLGVTEIAGALLTTPAAIHKRLQRAKRAMADIGTVMDVSGQQAVTARLASVHTMIYALFNEGYHGAHPQGPVKEDLCYEAVRLGESLLELQACRTPSTYALLALLALHAARIPGRMGLTGDLEPLECQDRSHWDTDLIVRGMAWLKASATGEVLTPYHLEAAIAAHHAVARHYDATDWGTVRDLYQRLYAVAPSPMVALNRAIAVAQAEGPDAAYALLESLGTCVELQRAPFLDATKAEIARRLGRFEEARRRLERAIQFARSRAEADFLTKRLDQWTARWESTPSQANDAHLHRRTT